VVQLLTRSKIIMKEKTIMEKAIGYIGVTIFVIGMAVSSQISTATANSDPGTSCTQICQAGSKSCGLNCQKM